MVFKAWKKLDQQGIAIKNMWIIIAILVFLNLCLVLSLANAPNKLRIYIPPDLTQGTTVQPGKIPKATIYAFAFQIFTAINSWPDSGEKEYGKNIHAYRNYLSAAFFERLKKDMGERKNNGELSRKRIMSAVSGMGYQPSDVKMLGNGVWRVNMKLEIVETLDGAVIKRVVMDYPLMVSRVSTSIQINPWGLVISGFSEPPYRIKTVI